MLEVGVEDVEAEAGDPALQPEAHDAQARGPDLRVVPVEVGLLGQERVEVVLTGLLVQRPRGAAEERAPVVRRAPAARRVAPDVPVAPRVDPVRARLLEPRVQVGRVVEDEVEDHVDAAAPRLGDQPVEVLVGAERGVDRAVVGDVVADVAPGRDVDRREPQALDAQRGVGAVVEVVELLHDAAQVADAVAVGIPEGARVDVVDGPALPPRQGGRGRGGRGLRRREGGLAGLFDHRHVVGSPGRWAAARGRRRRAGRAEEETRARPGRGSAPAACRYPAGAISGA